MRFLRRIHQDHLINQLQLNAEFGEHCMFLTAMGMEDDDIPVMYGLIYLNYQLPQFPTYTKLKCKTIENFFLRLFREKLPEELTLNILSY